MKIGIEQGSHCNNEKYFRKQNIPSFIEERKQNNYTGNTYQNPFAILYNTLACKSLCPFAIMYFREYSVSQLVREEQ